MPGTIVAPLSATLGLFLLWLLAAVVVVVLGTAGTALMNSPSTGRVRGGAVLVLLVSILAFPTLWGFFVGSLLMFIGAILGLAWEPPARPPAGTG